MLDSAVPSSLEILGDDIVYFERGHREMWRLPVASLLLVAERITFGSTLEDDYFFSFGSRQAGEMVLTECAVPGDTAEFLAELGARLGCEMKLTLGMKADFASRVLWPLSLKGKPLYVRQTRGKEAMLPWVKRFLFGGKTPWIVSAEVRRVLEG